MPELLNSELVESLAAALETLAFVSLSPAEEPLSPPDEPALVRIEYHRARRGRLEIFTCRGLGRPFPPNTLSCDPPETWVMPTPADALVELANITCGMLLKRI